MHVDYWLNYRLVCRDIIIAGVVSMSEYSCTCLGVRCVQLPVVYGLHCMEVIICSCRGNNRVSLEEEV